MPYFPNPLEDDEAAQGAPLPVGGGGTPVGAPGGAPGAAPVPGGAQAAPSRWANFSQVFAANQGGAQQTGNALADRVQAGAQDAQKGLSSAMGQFQTQAALNGSAPVAQGALPAGYPVRQAPAPAAPAPRVVPFGTQTQAQPSIGDTKRAGQLGTIDRTPTKGSLEAEAAQTYKGPNSVADMPGFRAANDKINTAQQQVDQLRSGTGREALLQQQQRGMPQGYARGQSRLDSALIGQASGARFGALRSQFGGLAKQRDDDLANSAAAANRERGNTAQVAANARGSLDELNRPAYDHTINTPYAPQAPGKTYTSNHVYAEEDPDSPGAKIATASTLAIPAAVGAIAGPAAGAGTAAVLGVNQKLQDEAGEHSRAEEEKDRVRRREGRWA